MGFTMGIVDGKYFWAETSLSIWRSILFIEKLKNKFKHKKLSFTKKVNINLKFKKVILITDNYQAS